MTYVTQEQMDIIDLIRGTMEKLRKYDEQALSECKGAGREFNMGRITAFRTMMDYLDNFEILEEEE